MDCEHFVSLICARLGHAISPQDRADLDAHLLECASCQATAEAFALQHEELQVAFHPRRQAALANAQQVNARLPASTPAAGRDSWMSEEIAPWMPQSMRSRLALVVGVVAAAAFLVILLNGWQQPTVPEKNSHQGPVADAGWLTPRPPSSAPETAQLAVGQELRTRPGERRRLALPDGSVMYINQNSHVRLDADRQTTLHSGTIFVEVAPRSKEEGKARFVVKTPQREVVALGTKFQVSAGKQDAVLVTQGKVQVRGEQGPGQVVQAGEALAVGESEEPRPFPRASHVLGWTRDLMAAAEAALVPASKFQGGALIAVDSSGQEAKLSLVKYKVDVHIEDGFARTTIDQTYFNHHPWRLEGTFYFPLPPDASLSRLAMYVNGKLMEGGMAERNYARQVYQQIVTSQKDPALLEWVDGSTFKMRVFPLEGRQEKRILLSYTQRLQTLYGQTNYRFPAGHNLQLVRDWEFHGIVKNGAGLHAASPTHPDMKTEPEGKDLVLRASAHGVKVDRDVVVQLSRAADRAEWEERIRFGSADHEDQRYLMLRFRPQLKTQARRQRRDWVFLFESSADRDPLLARAQIDIIRGMLAHAEHEDTFLILSAGTKVRTFPDTPLPVTPENVDNALSFLDQAHLIGTLDLGNAFTTARGWLEKADNPHLVHLGSGLTGMGVPQKELYDLLPDRTRYVGIGVGKRWGRSFMKECARRTGGYFTQINPDESIAWRSFDLVATLNTPRLLDIEARANLGLKAPADVDAPRFLIDIDSVCQGEALFAVARLPRHQETKAFVVPESITITGTLDGKPYERILEVRDITGGANYLPRIWAKLEIDRMLADQTQNHKDAIIALSKAMYVMTPYTSLLVLENEAMYKQFKVDRGRKDHWALYPAPEKIPVVYLPDPTQPGDVRNAPRQSKPSIREVRGTLSTRGSTRYLNGMRIASGVQIEDREKDQLKHPHAFDVSDFEPFQMESLFGSLPASRTKSTLGRRRWRQVEMLAALPIDTLRSPPRSELMYIPQQTTYSVELAGLSVDGAMPTQSKLPVVNRLSAEHRVKSSVDAYLNGMATATNAPVPLGSPYRAGLHFSGAYTLYEKSGVHSQFSRPQDWADPTTGKDLNPLGEDLGLRIWNINGIMPSSSTPTLLNDLDKVIAFSPDGTLLAPLTLGLADRVVREKSPARKWVDRSTIDSLLKLPSLTYTRPSFTEDSRLFRDLLLYAPGMNTSPADRLAMLEAEATPQLRHAPGHIDPEARKLLAGARRGGWRKLVFDRENRSEVQFLFDAAGRYVYEHTSPMGVHERVVCDGKTLLHLYPQLGLGARRTMSRFHRAEILRTVPWLVPPAEDLARGMDLQCVNERTVALVPHVVKEAQKKQEKPVVHLRTHLVFAADGRLAERQRVLMPHGKVILRELYDGKGGVRWLNHKGKDLAKMQLNLRSAQVPELQPDTSSLVVLPLPYRTRRHVYPQLDLNPSQSLAADQNGCFLYMERPEAMQVLAAALGENYFHDVRTIIRDWFQARGDKRRGFYTIQLACGVDLHDDPHFLEDLKAYPKHPLLRYLALQANGVYRYAQRRVRMNLGKSVAKDATFLRRLALAQDLYLRWQHYPNRWVHTTTRARDMADTVAFVRANRFLPIAWALLSYTQARGDFPAEHYRTLADTWGLLARETHSYSAHYEQARCLLYAPGGRAEARKLFEKFYEDTYSRSTLPLLDRTFRSALQGEGEKEKDLWSALIEKTARSLREEGNRPAMVMLAWQCNQLGDRPLADHLVGLALEDLKEEEQLGTTLLAVGYFKKTDQLPRADKLTQGLLARKEFSKIPALWRLASQLADGREQRDRRVAYLERALVLEYSHLPDVIHLRRWRGDYSALLHHYRTLSVALSPLDTKAPKDLVQRTVRAVDRWRAHEVDESQRATACELAASVLRSVGEKELAWEYLTTAVGSHPGEAQPWWNLARRLSREGDLELANRAFTAAAQADESHALVLWEQARNYQQMGKDKQANALLRKLVAGKWPEQYRGIQTRARWQLQGN